MFKYCLLLSKMIPDIGYYRKSEIHPVYRIPLRYNYNKARCKERPIFIKFPTHKQIKIANSPTAKSERNENERKILFMTKLDKREQGY